MSFYAQKKNSVKYKKKNKNRKECPGQDRKGLKYI